MNLALVAHRHTPTNLALARARPGAQILAPAVAVRTLTEGDTAIARLDVAERLDGIEVGLWELARLEGAGVRVLNRPRALIAAHDKLATARTLLDAGLPHPPTAHVTAPAERVPFEPPYVVKPRFGSWGRDVALCQNRAALRRHLMEIAARPWCKAHGALVQALVQPQGDDLRLVVAGSTVVGAISRVAPPGEWRTNIAHGATRQPVVPGPNHCELALAAARAIEGDFVGVDLLPLPDGGYTVIELNGAVDFTQDYAFGPEDIFATALEAILGDPVAAVA